jgi:hypothetical protein
VATALFAGCSWLVSTQDLAGGGSPDAGSSDAADEGPPPEEDAGGDADAGALPVDLATGQQIPYAVTTDTGGVYWCVHRGAVVGSNIVRYDKTTQQTVTIHERPGSVGGLAADGVNLLWTEVLPAGYVVFSATPPGGSFTMRTLQRLYGSFPFGGIAADALAGFAKGGGSLARVPKATTAPVQTVMADLGSKSAVAVDARYVYFADDVSLHRAKKELPAVDGGGFEVVAADDAVLAIVADDTRVYWSDDAAKVQAVRTADVPDAQPVILADHQDSPVALAVDGAYVYWTSLGNSPQSGRVRRVLLDGGAVETLASGLERPSSLAVDNDGIYWADEETGKVSMLAKR